MKSIAFFNNKGGVGKTTLSCNIASFLNERIGKRVLLIDADPQCNSTQSILSDEICEKIYLSEDKNFKTIYSFVMPLEEGESRINLQNEPILASSNRFLTDIIPGHPRLSIIEDRLSEAWSRSQGGDIGGVRVTNWCNQLLINFKDRYDIIIFDIGPSLGALNRTVLLSSDYILTPFGCDIFSLLGIKNISQWVKNWNTLYERAIDFVNDQSPGTIDKFPIIETTKNKFRLVGYSVQQYVSRSFKDGQRPVKAYDKIMQQIPSTITNSLDFLIPQYIKKQNLELGHIPYLYSLVPMAQSAKAPIHKLESKDGLVGSQYQQVKDYADLMENVCTKLLGNMEL